MLLVRLYQITLGPFLGGHCRFHPTCSNYALLAYEEHGAIRGTLLTVWRLLRCQPLCTGGFDPVPPRHRQPAEVDADTAPDMNPPSSSD